MLALLLVVLAQAPQCVTVGGARVCGYGCIENGSTAACAKSPQGVCARSGSQLTCFDPPQWLAPLKLGATPKPSCAVDGGNVACGYDCKREGGRVACAQTPKGVCEAHYGALTCFDPSPESYAVLQAELPAPKCVAQDGRVACGYSCTSGNGVVACAKTPFGICAENGGTPLCLDPPKEVICAKGASTPKPTCQRASGGTLVCGYHCKQAGAELACAKTPDGTCDTAGPSPVCFDPPVRGGSAACLEAMNAK
ncbi:MAG: hypothetical protein ACOZQL_07945 [Myxococcota bacterium]